MVKKKQDAWDRFEDTMNSLGDVISDWGEKTSKTLRGIDMGYGHSSSVSTTIQNGLKVVVKTTNGKTVITVNGKEYVPKDKK